MALKIFQFNSRKGKIIASLKSTLSNTDLLIERNVIYMPFKAKTRTQSLFIKINIDEYIKSNSILNKSNILNHFIFNEALNILKVDVSSFTGHSVKIEV